MDKIAMLKEILRRIRMTLQRYGLAMEHANQGDTTTALDEFQRLTCPPDYTAGCQWPRNCSSRPVAMVKRASASKTASPPRAAPATRSL
jgi:hypothetical protein